MDNEFDYEFEKREKGKEGNQLLFKFSSVILSLYLRAAIGHVCLQIVVNQSNRYNV